MYVPEEINHGAVSTRLARATRSSSFLFLAQPYYIILLYEVDHHHHVILHKWYIHTRRYHDALLPNQYC